MPLIRRTLFCLSLAATGHLFAGDSPTTTPAIIFERDIRPILKAHCLQCHGDEEETKGGVDLRLRRFMLHELDGGRHVLVPGQPEQSEMFLLVREGEMPKRGGKLQPAQIALLERWIAAGAPIARDEPSTLPPGPVLTEEERNYWAFHPVTRPAPPAIARTAWPHNAIDQFIAREHEKRSLAPAPEASREMLLRRVSLDLTGLLPTPAEQESFLEDTSPDAYEKVVDRLLASPAYGERWARHWMDVWRYSDWAGWMEQNQVRDSQRHIWRWRDWIVESLNADKGYDTMVREMIAGDELAPDNPDVLRATGFLVRNYKKLSREQWLEDTVKHTSQAFLGLTIGCAKCHNHMFDPIAQKEYYALRAIFEPHQVRIDPVPGEADPDRDGLARVYDADLNAPSWFFIRGDERHPDKSRPILPGVPRILGGDFHVTKVTLPPVAIAPGKQEFVATDLVALRAKELEAARAALKKLPPDLPELARREKEQAVAAAHARLQSLRATIAVEKLEAAGKKGTPAWETAATEAGLAQIRLAIAETDTKIFPARKACGEAEAQLCETIGNPASDEGQMQKAQKRFYDASDKLRTVEKSAREVRAKLDQPLQPTYTPREIASFPPESTGRRSAFARWLTDRANPLTARVAVNHIWLRHFGRGIVPTPSDFGRNGRPPSHPELLDWLASELMESDWSMKKLHRLIVTSSTYRMTSASTHAPGDADTDPDNIYLAHMPSRQLEAEAVRDNLLYVADSLDLTRGGPEIDEKLGLQSPRRSLYLRSAPEREVPFLKVFDGPNVTECYERRPSVTPQQALAMLNNELSLSHVGSIAQKIRKDCGGDRDLFIVHAFRLLLARKPHSDEIAICREFLEASEGSERACEKLVLALLNHNDFVTIR
jgi:hypothetical protein